jgi:hypothetical protein
MYGFHFIGVTVCSVPLLESIQPTAVRPARVRKSIPPAAAFPYQQRHVFIERRGIDRTPIISVRTHNHEHIRARPLTTLQARPTRGQAGGLRRRSCQFGRTSAPIAPHLVHTMRGPNEGTVRSPGRWSTLTITRCRQLWHWTSSERRRWRACSSGPSARWVRRNGPQPWLTFSA